MNNQIIKLTGLTLLSLAIAGCNVSADFDDPVEDISHSSGNADLATFVTIGDSITAGYADGALYLHGQNNSYPAILAQQFAKVGGGSFTQPLVSDNHGGLLDGGSLFVLPAPADSETFRNRLVLNAEPKDPPTDLDPKGPERLDISLYPPTTDITLNPINGIYYNNMGVPGTKSFHLGVPGYGNPAGLPASANPYYVRFAYDQAASSIIDDALDQNPSFYILWIGNNDILSYATSGGIGIDQNAADNLDPTTYGPNDITDDIVFAGSYSAPSTGLVTRLTTENPTAKGVLVNIPDVSTIPYFTRVPYNAIPLNATQAAGANGFAAYYNNEVAASLSPGDPEIATRTLTFVTGQNAVVIEDKTLTSITDLPSVRHATPNDLLLLSSSPILGTAGTVNYLGLGFTGTMGVTEGLTDRYALIPSELTAIEDARVAFNTTIKNTADLYPNLIFFDVAAVMLELSTTGIDYGTGFVDATYATGGAFSLDGVHPTARGYAVISNRMIDTINAALDATIPRVDPGAYSTIFLK